VANVIETEGLVKVYKQVQALKGVSLSVKKGEVFGLLGQNGAGKTTLIKILLGIVKKTAGEASLLEHPVGKAEIRKRVGYLPEDHRFPEYHTGYSLMDFYGELYKMGANDRKKKIPEILEQVGIAGRMHSKIRTYSKGMKQRLGVAQAIFHDPEVIFLDEPTDGVDPVGRREIREMIEQRKKNGATVFVNSHLLGEIELMCDRVAVMQRGSLVRVGTVDELTKKRNTYVIGTAPVNFPIESVRQAGYAVKLVEGGRYEVELPENQTIDPVLEILHTKGFRLRHLVEKKQTLEDVFISMIESSEPGVDRARKNRGEERL
jgi:ABC-2 type transport system ATP-binding protein